MTMTAEVDAPDLSRRIAHFMREEVYPAEARFAAEKMEDQHRWALPPVVRELQAKARAQGLWNLAMDRSAGGLGLSLTEYAPLAEVMSTSTIGTESFNCYSSTIWFAKLLDEHAGERIRSRYLPKVLNADIRVTIQITEPDESGSDPTSVAFEARREGDEYVLNGRKSWVGGGRRREAELALVLARTGAGTEAPRHSQHSLIAVPMDAPGLSIDGFHSLYGYEWAPNGLASFRFENVRVPVDSLIGPEGAGFVTLQGGIGIGRIAVAMESIGTAERALAEMCAWGDVRVISGRKLAERQLFTDAVAQSRMEIDQCRSHVLRTAALIETGGVKASRSEIAQCKVLAPNMAIGVLDRAMQFLGAEGLSHETPLAEMFAYQRSLRIGEGPDEVHRETIAKLEMARQRVLRTTSGIATAH